MAPIEITIDTTLCMGSGNCAFHAPTTFDIDDDMKAVLLADPIDPEPKLRLAAENCPTHAIVLSRDGVVVFPIREPIGEPIGEPVREPIDHPQENS